MCFPQVVENRRATGCWGLDKFSCRFVNETHSQQFTAKTNDFCRQDRCRVVVDSVVRVQVGKVCQAFCEVVGYGLGLVSLRRDSSRPQTKDEQAWGKTTSC